MRSGPGSAPSPSLIGLFSSVMAQVTELSVRGSGSPAGPVGFGTTRSAAAPVGPPASAPTGVVVFSHAARPAATPTPATAPAAPRASWRRVMPERSFGWATSAVQGADQLGQVRSQARVEEVVGGRGHVAQECPFHEVGDDLGCSLRQAGAGDHSLEPVHVGDRPTASERAQVFRPPGLEHELVLRQQESVRVVDLRVDERDDAIDQLIVRDPLGTGRIAPHVLDRPLDHQLERLLDERALRVEVVRRRGERDPRLLGDRAVRDAVDPALADHAEGRLEDLAPPRVLPFAMDGSAHSQGRLIRKVHLYTSAWPSAMTSSSWAAASPGSRPPASARCGAAGRCCSRPATGSEGAPGAATGTASRSSTAGPGCTGTSRTPSPS